jgi:hypothetical protein
MQGTIKKMLYAINCVQRRSVRITGLKFEQIESALTL